MGGIEGEESEETKKLFLICSGDETRPRSRRETRAIEIFLTLNFKIIDKIIQQQQQISSIYIYKYY